MNLLVFKIFLLAGGFLAVRMYVSRGRALGIDRFIIMLLQVMLVAAVIHPPITDFFARKLGIGRAADLAFYVGFILLLVLLAAQRLRLRDHERALTVLTRELAIREARPPGDAPQDQPISSV